MLNRDVRGKDIPVLITKFGIKVVGEMPLGRGTALMMTATQAASLVAEFKVTAAVETPASPADLHIGVLEAKVEQLTKVVAGQTEAINTLVKQSNILVDKLNKVLTELGSQHQ